MINKLFWKRQKPARSPNARCRAFRKELVRFLQRNHLTISTSLIAAALLCSVVYMLAAPLPEPSASASAVKTSTVPDPSAARAIVPLENYLQLLKTRNLFKPSVPIPEKNTLKKTTAEQLAQRLQFLGILEDNNQLSALISIAETGPAFFKVGDRLGQFVLKNIQKDKLTLQLYDEQVILKR